VKQIRRLFSWPLLTLACALLPALALLQPDDSALAQAPKVGSLVSFDQHLTHLQTATLEQYKNLPGVKVADAAAFNEMKAHLQALYKNLQVTHTFTNADGQVIDVVPVDKQPSLQHPLLKNHKLQLTPPTLAAAPQQAKNGKQNPTAFQQVAPQLVKGAKDANGQEMFCPPGSIPLRRITLTELTRFRTLKDYFTKVGPSQKSVAASGVLKPEFVASDGFTHRYATVQQTVNNYGGSSWLNLWSPVPSSGGMSLSQHWYTGGSPLQTVEGGWQVDPNHYGHNKPVLFIYWTADNYNKTGAYNLENTGFVQVNNSFVLGGAWNQSSTAGGTQWGFKLIWYRDPATGNWWLYLQGAGAQTAIGYYPKALYGTGQLSKYATSIAYGGEVAGKTKDASGQVVTGQMGSGAAASTGWQHAAFQNTIYYFPTGGNSAWANLSTQVVDSNHSYSLDIHNEGGNWGTYFFFGGSGKTFNANLLNKLGTRRVVGVNGK
jgi:hypothetical protein